MKHCNRSYFFIESTKSTPNFRGDHEVHGGPMISATRGRDSAGIVIRT